MGDTVVAAGLFKYPEGFGYAFARQVNQFGFTSVLEIQEFSATIAIGAFALVTFGTLLYLLFGVNLLERFGIFALKDEHGFGRVSMLIVALAFFGVGMVVENLSNRYVDTDKEPAFWARPGFVRNADDEGEWPRPRSLLSGRGDSTAPQRESRGVRAAHAP